MTPRDDFRAPAVLAPYDQDVQDERAWESRARLNAARAAAYALAILTVTNGAALMSHLFRNPPAQAGPAALGVLMPDRYLVALGFFAGLELIAVACGLLAVLYEGGKP